MSSTSIEQARAAKISVQQLLAPLVQLAGIGLTRVGDGFVIKVNLRVPPPPDVKLPPSVNGVPLRVEVVGGISRQKLR